MIFKIYFFKKILSENTIRVSKDLDPDQGRWSLDYLTFG